MITRNGEQPTEVREAMRGGNGQVFFTKLFSPLPEKMRVFSTLSMQPGDSIGYHIHEGETELFYFVKGRARVHDNETVYELGAGDVLSTSSGSGHSVENIGDNELLLLAVIVLDS